MAYSPPPKAVAGKQAIQAVAVLSQPPAARPVRKDAVIRAASSKVGRPYVWGAKGENNTFDCSGLTQYAWRQAGVEIGPSTYDQIHVGVPVVGAPQAGDLIFTRWGSRGPEHVALAVSSTQIIEAPGRGLTVRKNSMPAAFVAKRVRP